MAVPGAFARLELLGSAHVFLLYLVNYLPLFLTLMVQLAAAGLGGAMVGAYAPRSNQRTASVALQPAEASPRPAWHEGARFGVLASGSLALLVSTPVLLFGGEGLNRGLWLLVTFVVGLAFAALLAVAGTAAMYAWRRLTRS
jgi:hypothetical protein